MIVKIYSLTTETYLKEKMCIYTHGNAVNFSWQALWVCQALIGNNNRIG